MKPEIAKALSDHLDRHNQKEQEAVVRATERETEIAQNVHDFEMAKNALIKPALQELVDLYQEKGIAIRMTEQDEVVNRTGGRQPSRIGLDMAPLYGASDLKPQFSLGFNKVNRSLSLYTSTGSQGGPGGDISLDAITVEWIHDEFAKYQGLGTKPLAAGFQTTVRV
jgi:hypothetical protein